MIALIHLRTNLTTRTLAAVFRTSQSTVDRIIHNLTGQLADALKPGSAAGADPVHINDGTLIPVHDQTLTAPGKDYRRSINTQVIISATHRTLTTITPTWPGNRNDVIIARAELGDQLNNYNCLLGDRGYQGITQIETPDPGTDGRIIKNHTWPRHRRIRAAVEHVNARLKDWQIMRQYRRRGKTAINHTLQTVAGLSNPKRQDLRVNS